MPACAPQSLDAPAVRDVLTHAGIAHLAVSSAHGPHVTPHEFSFDRSRLWLVASTSSLKVRAIRRRPDVGLVVRAAGRAAVLGGRAAVLSLETPVEATRLAAGAPLAALAMGTYLVRNLPVMVGYGLDVATLRSGTNPTDRALVAVKVDWAFVADADGAAVAGWQDAEGRPVALPAAMADGDPTRAMAPLEVVARTGAVPVSPACLTVDASDGIRPSGFHGRMVRGPGVLGRREGDGVELTLRPELTTWWNGFAAGTVAAA